MYNCNHCCTFCRLVNNFCLSITDLLLLFIYIWFLSQQICRGIVPLVTFCVGLSCICLLNRYHELVQLHGPYQLRDNTGIRKFLSVTSPLGNINLMLNCMLHRYRQERTLLQVEWSFSLETMEHVNEKQNNWAGESIWLSFTLISLTSHTNTCFIIIFASPNNFPKQWLQFNKLRASRSLNLH